MSKDKGVKKAQSKTVILENLNIMRKKLENYKQGQSNRNKVNVYSAIGINSQEIRHSAFLAWLFRSDESHGFKNKALSLFLKKLVRYTYNDVAPQNYKDNVTILKDSKIDVDNFDSYLQGNISVETEKHYSDIKVHNSNIDLLISIKESRTVIVIENKIFSSTHSDQLVRYEKELDKQKNGYSDYNKIFVYLTPDGELPINKGGDNLYNDKWCILDYNAVVEICKELRSQLTNSKEHKKNKLVLEDYMETVDINVLKKDGEINKLLRELSRDFPTEVELLKSYTDNIVEVLEYCKKKLVAEMPEIKNSLKSAGKSFSFYTSAMEQYFAKNGESITRKKCRWYFGSDGVIVSCILMDKAENGWDKAQKLIVKNADVQQFRCMSTELLSWEERERSFAEIKPTLDNTLDMAIVQLKEFDSKLQQSLK